MGQLLWGWLEWLCGPWLHTFFYLCAFLLAVVGLPAFVTGNRKLNKIFIILALLTVLSYFICLIFYVRGHN
ncbi:MAG: hypothetical protein Q7R73_05045 [bacterium]|nr:hypothetical protein [bacterium]